MYKGWYDKGGKESLFSSESDYLPPDIKGVKRVYWNPRRIPVTDNSGFHVMLDLDPTADGQYGQAIEFAEEGPTKVIAASWADYLDGLANGLESRKLVFVDGEVQPKQ